MPGVVAESYRHQTVLDHNGLLLIDDRVDDRLKLL